MRHKSIEKLLLMCYHTKEGGAVMLCDKSIRRDKKKCALPRRVLLKLREICGKRSRERLNAEMAKRLEGADFTVFSNNCLGTMLYHDSGKEYTTPLINTAMDGTDFLKLLENPRHYLKADMQFVKYEGIGYPIARIDDIEIRFVHYKTEAEAREKFYKRAERINWDNIVVIATNHDGLYTTENMARFDKLPYKKLMFVSEEYEQYPWAVCVPQFKGRFQVRIMTSFANFKGQRYYETAYDIISFLQVK